MSLNIKTGNSALVKATFKDAAGNICSPHADVTWSSNSTGVATVAASNLSVNDHYNRAQITGVSAGTATITAASFDKDGGAISATLTVTVYDEGATTVAINVL